MKKITFFGTFVVVLSMFILLNVRLHGNQNKKPGGGIKKPEPSIKVLEPKIGDVWCKGGTYTIKWRKSGDLLPRVRILLRNKASTDTIQVIEPEIDNNGSYNWIIPTTIPNGAYVISIRGRKTGGGSISGDSKIFEIKFCVTKGAPKVASKLKEITVTEPRKEVNWKEGDTRVIKWKTILHRPFGIDLYQYHPKQFIRKIGEYKAKLYPTDGKFTYSWALPTDILKAGLLKKKFIIRLYTLDTPTIEGFSERFYIKPLVKTEDINITIPAQFINKHWRYKSRHLHTDEDWNPLPESTRFGIKPGTARVGFHNQYASKPGMGDVKIDWVKIDFIFRARVNFDVGQFTGKRGVLHQAILKLEKQESHAIPIPMNCGRRLYILEKEWTELFWKIPGYHYKTISRDDVVTVDISPVVQTWIAEPSANHGVLLIGGNEKAEKNNFRCVTYYRASLEIKFTEYIE